MNEAQFYQDLLALPDLVVTHIEHEPQRITVEGHIPPQATPCPVCAEPTALVNQYDRRKVQDLSISGKDVWLHLRLPQLACQSCPRYFTTPPKWIMPGKSYTRRQAKWVLLLCAKQPFTEVAALVNLSHKTVERLYYEMADEVIDLPSRYAQVRKLGIDEVAHRKGKHGYVCVLTDLDRGLQLSDPSHEMGQDVLPDRKKATLVAHFEALGPKFCAQIEGVAFDMWRVYRDVAQQCFPQAELVVDRFHVVKALNDVLDCVRRTLRRAQPEEEAFKGIKWMLFKRREHLTETEEERLELALSHSWLLAEVYALRQTFHAAFDLAGDAAWLGRELQAWMDHAEGVSNKHMERFLGTLRRWFEPITAYASSGITNAVTEGLNNCLRYMTRISFGLPKFEHMRVRVLMASG